MDMDILKELKRTSRITITMPHPDEVYVNTAPEDFSRICNALHQGLRSPVMAFFACDDRARAGHFSLICVFAGGVSQKWFLVRREVPADAPVFDSLARDIFSASLFEREIREMFGLEPKGNPDLRRLRLHDEAWPCGFYPLRKDFKEPAAAAEPGRYRFKRIEGEGVFEIPVGPVHAGVIGPGHFRFSVAGEPVINLEARLGFTHRGVEKLFEGKTVEAGVELAEVVSGDSSFAHALSFCRAAEKAFGIAVPDRAQIVRAVFLELERMYNHASDIGGIALDVGFSFPAAYAALLKESLLSLNEKLTGSRYLKGAAVPGGVERDLNGDAIALIKEILAATATEACELRKMLLTSVSFMDRADGTGTLQRKIAEDLGVTGLAGRASGIARDCRKDFPGVYAQVNFTPALQETGDVLARLRVRFDEFDASLSLVAQFLALLGAGPAVAGRPGQAKHPCALGYCEGWRGPVVYWLQLAADGTIDRCKVVDPSFRNWQGLCHAIPGNIVPDFPLCNKSFDLSYPGNDL